MFQEIKLDIVPLLLVGGFQKTTVSVAKVHHKTVYFPIIIDKLIFSANFYCAMDGLSRDNPLFLIL